MKLKITLFLLLTSMLASAQVNIGYYIQTGRVKLGTNDYVGAIENFNIVIKFKPQLPEPYFYRGHAKHMLDDYRGAITDYSKALEIKPYFPQALENRAHAYLSMGKFEDAITDYTAALELSPGNSGIYNNRGIAKISNQDIAGAIVDYDKALELQPNFVNALINRSNAYIAQGDERKAIRDLNRIVIMRPHYSSVYLLRGLARFEMDDYAAALRDFDQTIRFDPESAFAFNNRGLVKQRLEDYQGAIMDYDMALQLDPTMPNAYFNRAIAKEATGAGGADEDFRIAAQLDPRYHIPNRSLEDEYRAQQQQQQQQQSSNQSSSNQQSGSQPAATQPAAIDSVAQAKAMEEEERARRRFRLSLADSRNIPDPEDAAVEDGQVQNKNVIIEIQDIFRISAFVKNSVNYDRLQYYSPTVEQLNKYNSYIPQLTIDNAEQQDFMQSFSANIDYFNGKININPSAENLLSRGIFQFLHKQNNLAIEDFDASIRLNDKNELAYFSRANCRLKMIERVEAMPSVDGKSTVGDSKYTDDYKSILKDYDKVIKLNADFPFAYYNKAYVLCRIGKYEEALNYFELAVQKQPDMAEAYFNRGLTKIYLDNIEGGAADLSKAGELGIDGAYNIIKRFCN
ncbi:MAG: tetratricopeptide repeat protein [Bacteroidales bacterium]